MSSIDKLREERDQATEDLKVARETIKIHEQGLRMYTVIENGIVYGSNEILKLRRRAEKAETKLITSNDTVVRLQDIMTRLITWLDHPALSRVCVLADTHGIGLTKDEVKDGHKAVTEARIEITINYENNN